jgi:hypothetical protein
VTMPDLFVAVIVIPLIYAGQAKVDFPFACNVSLRLIAILCFITAKIEVMFRPLVLALFRASRLSSSSSVGSPHGRHSTNAFYDLGAGEGCSNLRM